MAANPGELPRHESQEEPQINLVPRPPVADGPDWSQDLVAHSRDLLCVHDLAGRLLWVNPGSAKVLGYTVEELLGFPMRGLIDPTFRDEFDTYLQEIARTAEARGTLAVLTRGGKRCFWEYHCTLRTDSIETPVVRGIAHDVTERIEAEKSLRDTNRILRESKDRQASLLRGLQLFRAQLDHCNDAIEVVDPVTLRLLDVNEQSSAQLGYTREELLSMTIFDIDPMLRPEMVVKTSEVLQRTGSKIFESVHRRKDGTSFPVEVNLRRVQLDRAYIVAISRDLSERKLRDERLKVYARVVQDLEEMITVVDHDHRYVLANRAYLAYHNMTEEQVIGRHISEVLTPGIYESVIRGKLDDAFRGNSINYPLKYDYSARGERDLIVTYLPIEEPGGVNRVAVVLRDVTHRERAEAVIRKSEQRLSLALESAEMGFWEHDHATNTTTRNLRHDQIFGHESLLPVWTRDTFLAHLAPEDRDTIQKRMAENWTSKSFSEECPILWLDNTRHWILTRGRTFVDDDGRPVKTLGTVMDITARKHAEEALRESEERMRLAHEAAQIGIFERDMQNGGSSWSRQMADMHGIPVEMAPRSVDDMLNLIHPADREKVRQLIDDSIETGTADGEWRVVWPDGSIHWIAGRWRMFKDKQGRPLRALGVDIDITRRKEMEVALRTREAELREAQRVAQMGSWRLDVKSQTLTATEQLFRVAGQKPMTGSIPFDELSRFFPPDSWQQIVAASQRALLTGQTEDLEISFRRGDGTIGWLLTRTQIDRDDARNIEALHGIAIDVTGRKRAEEALRESEERLRLAQEAAKIGAFDRNMQSGEAHWTREAEEMFGLAPGTGPRSLEEFFGLIHPADRQHVEHLMAMSTDTGRVAGEWRVIWPDRSVHWIDGRWRVFRDEQGRPLRAVGINSDITDRKRVEEELRHAKERLTEEKMYLEHEIDTELGFEEIIGESKTLKSVMESVAKVASSDATVLLLGETGTGKELVARAIHRLSRRAGNAFIKMNCAAIPTGLLESELFGNEKGAFTGAVNRKIGRLELADRGTLFLDEIGEISLALQPKLLRILQDQEFERLGGTHTLKVDFRLIAATNQDLARSVREKEFRSDLFYRLNVFPIFLPPLRERRDDIPLLVEHFVQKIGRRLKKSVTSVPKRTMDALIAWSWPGNIRELENFIERSLILSTGSVLNAPSSELRAPLADVDHQQTLKDAERRYILDALRESHGRISGPRGAANRLGLKRTTLQSKLKQLGINPNAPPPVN